MRVIGAMLLALVFSATGCSPSDGSLVIFAASSLAQVLADLAPDAQVNAAGSDTIAAQLREGATADIYASAGLDPATSLRNEGLIEEPVVFARNRIVIIVPAADPAGIETLADVGRAGVRLVVGAPGLPIGDYTRRVLVSLGASDVLERAVSEEQNVAAIAGKVSLGEADAGFVYATDVPPLGARVRLIELPSNPVEITAVISVVSATRDRSGAEAFIARVLGDEGRRALVAAGFGVP